MEPAGRSPIIAAIASAPAAGGVGIVRLSGAGSLEAARPLARSLPPSPKPRRAYFTDFLDEHGAVLDQGLLLFFEGPHSFTGEDVVELHAHGSPRLLQLLLRRLLSAPGVRAAEPGEFTKRAYLNGRLDLARAEAVADLVAAGSEAAVRAAAAQASGALSARVRALREPLLDLRAQLEGALEFPEEVPGEAAGLPARLGELAVAARALLAEGGRGRLLRRGARVVLFGPVNAGKSTLLNRLVEEERALVDAEPGTTRDAIEASFELEGLPLTLVDTAGFRAGGDGGKAGRLEALGIERALGELRRADLAVLLVPPGAGAKAVQAWSAEAGTTPVLAIAAKCDLANAPGLDPALPLGVSGRTGEGVAALRRALVERLFGGGVAEAALLTSERHADALRRALEAIERAGGALACGALEGVAGELGLAAEALGDITGESASDELVDAIFRRFCLGK